MDINFDVTSITESRLNAGQKALNNINIENYLIEHTTTDASCSRALFLTEKGIT